MDFDSNFSKNTFTGVLNQVDQDKIVEEELEAKEDEKRFQKEMQEELERKFENIKFNDTDSDEESNEENSYSTLPTPDYNAVRNLNDHTLSNLPVVQKHNDNPIKVMSDEYTRKSANGLSYQELHVYYDIRLREIKQLKDELEQTKKEYSLEKREFNEMSKRAHEENRKIIDSRDQLQKALVDTTTHLRDTEKELLELKQKLADSDSEKRDALHNLEICKMTMLEQENRLKVLNTQQREEANFDCVLKELTSKYKQDVNALERKLNNLQNKLKETEQTNVKREKEIESLFHEKETIIRNLESNLNKCHSQYDELMKINKNHDKHRLHLQDQLDEQVKNNKILEHKLVNIENLLHDTEARNTVNNKKSTNENSNTEYSLSANKDEENIKLLQLTIASLEQKTQEVDQLNKLLSSTKDEYQQMKLKLEKYETELKSLKKQNDELRCQLSDTINEKNSYKTRMMEVIKKLDMDYQEKLHEYQLTNQKEIIAIKSSFVEGEVRLKSELSKIYAEEMKKFMEEFTTHVDHLNKTIDEMNVERNEFIKLIKTKNESMEKIKLEINKVYSKYINARNHAIKFKTKYDDEVRRCRQYFECLKSVQEEFDRWVPTSTTDGNANKGEELNFATKCNGLKERAKLNDGTRNIAWQKTKTAIHELMQGTHFTNSNNYDDDFERFNNSPIKSPINF